MINFFLKNEKNSFNVNDRLCCCYVATAVTVVAMIYSKFMVYFIFCFANISLKALFSYTILFICCGCGAIYYCPYLQAIIYLAFDFDFLY